MGCESSSIASSDRQDNYSYVTYWSFGERLPVVEEKVRSTDSIRVYLETIAALVAHRLDHTDLLVESPKI